MPRDPERQEFDMSNPLDWNAKIIAEFRANEGRVGGNFEGAPMVLVHHRGRKSGQEYVNPMMYLRTTPSRTPSTSSQPRLEHPPTRTGTTT
jgi:hypothetical protein